MGRYVDSSCALHGAFCADCGQNHRHLQLRLGSLLLAAVDTLTNADGKLWQTLIGLSNRPGRFCADYVDGRRVSKVQPFKYFVFVVAVMQLVTWLVDRNSNVEAVEIAADVTARGAAIAAVARTMCPNLSWVWLALVPLLAGALRVLFGGRLRSYADDLVFCLYLLGHHSALMISLELFQPPPAVVPVLWAVTQVA